MYFSGDSSCFIYFDVIIHQQLKKSSSLFNFVCSRVNEVKTWIKSQSQETER